MIPEFYSITLPVLGTMFVCEVWLSWRHRFRMRRRHIVALEEHTSPLTKASR